VDKIFKALADVNRRRILTLLKEKEYSVNELLINFTIGQATLSNHLAVLRKAELVNFRVVGKQRIYRLNNELLIVFAQNMRKFVGIIDERDIQDIAIRPRRV
jgi:ArsR family transcriptional regulator, arsenate/arsenite/antimonite-responsive transcriptional repressor